MGYEIDQLDEKIIRLLNIDGCTSISELAEKAGSSRPTIAKRMKRLKDKKLIINKSGLNLRKFKFRISLVGMEVRTDKTREEIERIAKNCPRVLNIFRTHDKANIHLILWGEDNQTITSTIESFRDQKNVNIIYTHYLGSPIHGDIAIQLQTPQNKEAPCGKVCVDCYRYQNSWCLGCPSTKYFKTPFQKLRR
jgi:DNA-binding Lrp family transcriptional regulator